MAVFAQGRGDAAGHTKYRRACYAILAPRIARGVTSYPAALRVYEELKKEFEK